MVVFGVNNGDVKGICFGLVMVWVRVLDRCGMMDCLSEANVGDSHKHTIVTRLNRSIFFIIHSLG